MKKFLRIFIIESLVLYFISSYTTGLHFQNGMNSLLITGCALAVSALLIKPVINILILPLNLLTFGVFKWVGNAVSLYLIDLVLPQFTVSVFAFKNISSQALPFSSISVGEPVSYLAYSLLISFVTGIIYWLIN